MTGVSSANRSQRAIFPVSAAIILCYFLFFTGRSVGMYFDADDMMNLYLAWSKPAGQLLKANVFFWSDFYRPLGSLFYRAGFAIFGFNPLPFRVACLALGAGNIGLCYWFTRLVSGSGRVAALASLIFAFHPRLIEVWYRTAMIYDLLCFTFFFLAACLYIDGRSRGSLGAVRALLIAICYMLGLDSKEAAVTLPVILLAWELFLGRCRWRELWLIVLLGLMNVPYIFNKTHGASTLAGNLYYHPDYNWIRFAGSCAHYVGYVFLRDEMSSTSALAILLILLAVAAVAWSRILAFAWVVFFTCMLPVCFIPDRGGYAIYLSWTGWVLFAAVALVGVQDLIVRRWPAYRPALACLIFVLVGWRLGKVSLHEQRNDPRGWLYDPPAAVKSMTEQMRALHPSFPRGTRMLFVEDAFSGDEWTPYFIMKLAWHDGTMVVDRIKMMNGKVPDWKDYQYVFAWDGSRYSQLQP